MQCPPTPARFEDRYARMQIGETDCFPDVDAELIRLAGEFVGDGDVHVAKRVFHQFDHLGRRRVGEDNLAAHENAVQIAAGFRRSPVDTAHDTCVFDQLGEDLAR